MKGCSGEMEFVAAQVEKTLFALGDNSQGGGRGALMKVNGGLITHSLAVTGTGTQLKVQSAVRQEHRTCKGTAMRLDSTFPSSGC